MTGWRGHALRFVICAAIGAAAGVVAWTATGTSDAVAVGWDAAAIAYTAHVWITLSPASADQVVAWSSGEDEGRWAITLLLTAAAAASGVAVFDMASHGAAALAAVTILSSWALVHTVFAAHYAHRCFSGGPKSPGLEFPGERPRFSDFAYYSFTIGMTFQTSDVDTKSGEMRLLTLVHGVVSFIFNTVIIAISVGLASGLIGGN